MAEVSWVNTGEAHTLPFVESGDPHAIYWQYSGDITSFVLLNLQDLTDVDGTTDAPLGSVLAKSVDGSWRPTTIGAAVGAHITYNQVSASTEWLVDYSLLASPPAGIRVILSDGTETHPGIEDYPETKQMVFSFSRPVSGRVEMGE